MNRYYGDYHTHTRYSEGRGSIRDNIEAARLAGLHDIGISDHGYNNYSLALTRKKSIRQQKEIQDLRQKYDDIKILYSIEADIISLDGSLDMELHEMEPFDYIIAGFHRWTRPKTLKDLRQFYMPVYRSFFREVRAKDIVRNTDATIKMLERYPISILAHINNATHVDCKAVAEVCAELGTYVELNVKHIIKNLGNGNMEKVLETKAMFIASSDAHAPHRIGKLESVDQFIKPYGIDDRIVNLKDSTPNFRTIRNWRK